MVSGQRLFQSHLNRRGSRHFQQILLHQQIQLQNRRNPVNGLLEEVPSYFADTVLNSMFLSYLEYRKENGKEVKGKAIGYCIDKLESLSNSPAEQVAIIKQTIQNGWTDFFPYGKG